MSWGSGSTRKTRTTRAPNIAPMPALQGIVAKALENALQGRVYMISWDQWRGQTRKHLFPIILIVSGLYTGMLPTTSILII